VIALGHGGFLPWIDREFGISDQTAHRFIHVANMAGQIPQIVEFQPSVLYALGAPSTPEEVRTVVAEKAADPPTGHAKTRWVSSAAAANGLLAAV
jgi:hypothetical protein